MLLLVINLNEKCITESQDKWNFSKCAKIESILTLFALVLKLHSCYLKMHFFFLANKMREIFFMHINGNKQTFLLIIFKSVRMKFNVQDISIQDEKGLSSSLNQNSLQNLLNLLKMQSSNTCMMIPLCLRHIILDNYLKNVCKSMILLG